MSGIFILGDWEMKSQWGPALPW